MNGSWTCDHRKKGLTKVQFEEDPKHDKAAMKRFLRKLYTAMFNRSPVRGRNRRDLARFLGMPEREVNRL